MFQSPTRPWFGSLLALALLGGCTGVRYTTPSEAADLMIWQDSPPDDPDRTGRIQPGEDSVIRSALDRRPAARFPASIAIARVQAPGYRSHTVQGHGTGAFSVVIQRDVETKDHFKTLSAMPEVRNLAPISRLLLPSRMKSDQTLRRAAAAMRSDVLLIYTLDTRFHRVDTDKPLDVVTVGILDNFNVEVYTTASAVFLDTRTGYVYGVSEGSSKKRTILNNWSNDEVVDAVRREVEAKAFDELVKSVVLNWTTIANEYGGQKKTPTADASDVQRTTP